MSPRENSISTSPPQPAGHLTSGDFVTTAQPSVLAEDGPRVHWYWVYPNQMMGPVEPCLSTAIVLMRWSQSTGEVEYTPLRGLEPTVRLGGLPGQPVNFLPNFAQPAMLVPRAQQLGSGLITSRRGSAQARPELPHATSKRNHRISQDKPGQVSNLLLFSLKEHHNRGIEGMAPDCRGGHRRGGVKDRCPKFPVQSDISSL